MLEFNTVILSTNFCFYASMKLIHFQPFVFQWKEKNVLE